MDQLHLIRVWCGPVCKLLSKVEASERKTEFIPIPLPEPLVKIEEDVVEEMSSDSKLVWRYPQAMQKGSLILIWLLLNVENCLGVDG